MNYVLAKRHSHWLLVFSAITCLLLIGSAKSLTAQSDEAWSQPLSLIPADQTNGGYFPEAVSDKYGHVHLIWSSWQGSQPSQNWASNTIYYTRWDGVKWSQPVDIMTSLDNQLRGRDIDVSPDNEVVITWESGGAVGVSYAPFAQAASAQSWQSTGVGTGSFAQLAMDHVTGDWHVAHVSTDLRSILRTSSIDSGKTWSLGDTVWSTDKSNLALTTWELVADSGILNVLWSEHNEARGWAGQAIWHARLAADSDQLATAREVHRSQLPEQPTLDAPVWAGSHDGVSHIFWNNGVGTTTGRFQQLTLDNGHSWSQTQPVFPGLSGQTGQAGAAYDSAGVLHYVSAANGFGSQGSRIRYAAWLDGQWSELQTPWTDSDLPDQSGEHPAIAITTGNVLHVFWDALSQSDSGLTRSTVMYAQRTVDAPYVAPAELPPPLPVSAVPVAAEPEADRELPGNLTESSPAPSIELESTQRIASPPGSPMPSVGIGVMATMLLLVATGLGSWLRTVRR